MLSLFVEVGPRLALNHDIPVCFFSSWDYRREPQNLAKRISYRQQVAGFGNFFSFFVDLHLEPLRQPFLR
jgi:hypothetical protein